MRTPLNAPYSPIIVRIPRRRHVVPPTVESLRCVPFCVLLQPRMPEDGLDQETQAALQGVHGIESVSCQLLSWSWHIRLKSMNISEYFRVEGENRKLDKSSRVSDGFSLLRDRKVSSPIRGATVPRVNMIVASESCRCTPVQRVQSGAESQNTFVIHEHQF